ncbi:replication-relaxation family protein [uncultured Roseobacter sp.]|uniref:replication-relaxation family protein n=1 Tax=uncultured Roseobacter sp. TaxID=114847 RepID=UPI00260F2297|nr:replication-relaxation family protein [uncultured Roseobacter sp.]
MNVVKERKKYKMYKPPAPDDRLGIDVQERDLEIMTHIWRYRLIESSAIFKLFPNSSEDVLRGRLKLMFDNELIDRPRAQRSGKTTGGSKHKVYAIKNQGAYLVQKHVPFDIKPTRWTQKNKELATRTVDHHLSTSRFASGLHASAAAHGDVQMKYIDEIIPRNMSENRPAGLFTTLRADVRDWTPVGLNEGTAADLIVALESSTTGGVFMIEIDEGTETITPGKRQRESEKFWSRTSYLRKLLIYGAAFRAKAHQKQLGIQSFRKLTITTNRDRVAEMQACYRNHLGQGSNKVHPGLFLFSDWETLDAADDFLSAQYVNAANKPVSLIPA